MPLTVVVELPENLYQQILGVSLRYYRHVFEAIAISIKAQLKGPNSLWPVDTGYSKGKFETRKYGDSILVQNRVYYAGPVNFVERFRSGKPNRNYLAVQRTIEKLWGRITQDAAKLAERTFNRDHETYFRAVTGPALRALTINEGGDRDATA